LGLHFGSFGEFLIIGYPNAILATNDVAGMAFSAMVRKRAEKGPTETAGP
jgi:hypothetical protein